jgi:hypothetical protein
MSEEENINFNSYTTAVKLSIKLELLNRSHRKISDSSIPYHMRLWLMILIPNLAKDNNSI